MSDHATFLDPTDPFEEERDQVHPRLVGIPGVFRLFFVGSPILHLLEHRVAIGPVTVHQTEAPVEYKYTDVLTVPGPIPILRKVHHHLRSRPGVVTTVLDTHFQTPSTGLAMTIAQARRDAEMALAALVALLDERVADSRLGEIVVLHAQEGDILVDVTKAVRPYDHNLEKQIGLGNILGGYASLDLHADPSVGSALSCYLAAIEQRMTPPGFVLLAGALDALCPGKRNRMNVKDLESELATLGIHVDRVNLVRIVGARGDIVHKGFNPDRRMREAWYDTEELVRAVLQRKLGAVEAWPARVPMTTGPTAIDGVVDKDLKRRRTKPRARSISQLMAAVEDTLTAAQRGG